MNAHRPIRSAMLGALLCTATFAHAASGIADLEVLQVRTTGVHAPMQPAFDRERTGYRLDVASDITAVQVRPGAVVSASRVTVNGQPVPYLNWQRVPLKAGDNPVDVEVRSTDGTGTRHYTVVVHRDDDRPVTDAFEKASLTDPRSGLTMPYRLFVPKPAEAASGATPRMLPLVVFLHGGGENGTDNERQLHGTEGATVWAQPAEQAVRPAYVLALQARPYVDQPAGVPLGGFGVTRNARAERFMDDVLKPSTDVQLALLVLQRVLDEHPDIDRRRIYLTGLSQGGFGTWNMAIERPDLFAAAVPIAGGGDPARMQRIVDLPVWAFHAERDPVVPVHYSRDSVAALRALGGQPRYTEYPDGTYFESNEHASWVYAYGDPQMRAWLFRQARP